jgi:ubiquinone/menaquinone biosynthesis C-methylase UbiE
MEQAFCGGVHPRTTGWKHRESKTQFGFSAFRLNKTGWQPFFSGDWLRHSPESFKFSFILGLCRFGIMVANFIRLKKAAPVAWRVNFRKKGLIMILDDPFVSIAETFDWIHSFRGDIPFWINQATRNSGPVLELGCGTGRATWEIANAGCPIVGIDLSLAMLKIADSKRARYPEAASVILKQADMRDFSLGVKFNTIILPGRTFEFSLTTADQIKTITSCLRHLNEKGNIVIFTMGAPDLSTPAKIEYLTKVVQNPNTGNNCRLYQKNEIDYAKQISSVTQRLEEISVSGDVVREWRFPAVKYRWSQMSQLDSLADELHLKIVARFSDWLRRPYRSGDSFMIVVFEK